MKRANDFFDRIEGTWSNQVAHEWRDQWGWNLVTHPTLGGATRAHFDIRVDQMREVAIFKKVHGTARNIGAAGRPEYWKAIAYEISIQTPNGEAIHHEMGHFLLEVRENGTTPEPLRANVVRLATIPHANASLTSGVLRRGTIADALQDPSPPAFGARPKATDAALQVQIDDRFSIAQSRVAASHGPDLESPLTWLQHMPGGKPVDEEWVLDFADVCGPANMANGQRVMGAISVGPLTSSFWIAAFEMADRIVDVLRYVQRVDLNYRNAIWPHIALNTLVRQGAS